MQREKARRKAQFLKMEEMEQDARERKAKIERQRAEEAQKRARKHAATEQRMAGVFFLLGNVASTTHIIFVCRIVKRHIISGRQKLCNGLHTKRALRNEISPLCDALKY